MCSKSIIFTQININFVSFKIMPSWCNIPVPALEAILICLFWWGLELFQRCGLCLLTRGKTPSFHRSFSVWKKVKSRKGPSPMNTTDETWWRSYSWSKYYEQTMTCKLGHYRVAISMTFHYQNVRENYMAWANADILSNFCV